MRSLFIMLIYSLSIFAETYISGSIITNSNISGYNMVKKGSGILINRTVNPTKSFNKINLDTVGDIVINHSLKDSISIRTDNNLIDNILFYIENRTLFIKIKGSINPTQGLKITINSRLLDKLMVNGTSDIVIKDYQLDNFLCKTDGVSNIDMLDSTIKNADIQVDGTGTIKVNVTQKLKISIDGTAEIRYRGNPKIEKEINGVADIVHIK